MNHQIRRTFLVVLVLFASLGIAATSIQVLQAPTLNADSRNSRTVLRAAEQDRGPIIVQGTAIASSQKEEGSRRYTRHYNPGALYAPITGYFSAGFNSATGLESAMDTVLRGDSSALLTQRLKNMVTGAARRGGGVELTVNPAIQQAAADGLGNRKGAVVALDPKTGAVLALYSSPSYDPNPLADLSTDASQQAFEALENDPSDPLKNRAIAGDRYAPGSTFKVLTSISLLEKGIVTADKPVESPVTTTLPGTATEVSNIESAECGNGNPSFAEAFARSCNTTFIIQSQQLTNADLTDVGSRFGFGREMVIPMRVTESVIPTDMDASQLAMASIGQYDVQVTPLEMAMVAQAVANGGELMNPYLVAAVVDSDLQRHATTTPASMGEATTPEVAATMKDLMVGVTSQPYGTGQTMALPGISVAAKTGTAEVGDMANAWTIGFAPADDPKIAFAVVVEGDENDPVPHGGDVAGPIARSMLEVGLG